MNHHSGPGGARTTASVLRAWLRAWQCARSHGAGSLLLEALVAAGVVVRIAEVFLHNPLAHLFSDPGRHWQHAKETLSPGPWALVDPPLYQIWLSIVQKWSLGLPVLVGALHAALSVVTPWLWYRYFREILKSKELALAGWVVLVWLPSWIGIYDYFMTETLLLPLLGASLWQTARTMRLRTVPALCGALVLWLLASLTRAVAAPFGAILLLWAWAQMPRKLAAAGWSILIVAAIAAPLALRNHEMVGLWSPLGSGWPNQIYASSGKGTMEVQLTRDGARWGYGFGSPSMQTKPFAPFSNWEISRPGSVVIQADLRKGSEDWRAAYERTALIGWGSLRLRLENFVIVMMENSWPDNNPDYTVAAIENGMRWVWLPLTLFVLGAMAIRWDLTLSRPIVPVLIFVWLAVQSVSLVAVNEGRYRKPLEGLLVAELLVLLDAGWLSRRRVERSPP